MSLRVPSVCWAGILVASSMVGPAAAQFSRIETIAGNGTRGPAETRGRALSVSLSNPFGVQPMADGALVVASFDQHVVYRLTPDFKALHRIAGTGESGQSDCRDQDPRKVQFNQPHELQVDAQGNIFVADTLNHRVGMISAGDGRWRCIAGTGRRGFSGDGGPAVRADLDQAYSIAVWNEELWICDLGNHRIRHVDLKTGMIRTISGTGIRALPADGALAADQPLAGPRSVAVDADNLWVVLREGNSVWRIARDTGRIYHVAGTGEKGMSGDGGDARLATFRGPKGIAVVQW